MSLAALVSLGRALAFIWAVPCIVAQSTSTETSSMTFLYPTSAPLLTVNIYDNVDVEWESNFDQTWLVLYCNEYKAENNGQVSGYMWSRFSVKYEDTKEYSPWWNFLKNDGNNRTGLYPYACWFKLEYDYDSQAGIDGPSINITSIEHQGWNFANTTFALRSTQVATPTPTATSASFSLTRSSTSVPTSPATASTAAAPTATSTSPTNSDTTSTSSTGSLSSGAKGGIAAGVVVGVLALAAFGYMFYRNHRKLKALESRTVPQEASFEAKPPKPGAEYYGQTDQPVPPSELEAYQRYQLPAGHYPQEMATQK